MSNVHRTLPERDRPTTLRLRLCVAMIALIGLVTLFGDHRDLPTLIIHVLSFPVLLWVGWIGVYRGPALHRLWGIGCLVGSLAIVGILICIALGRGPEHLRALPPLELLRLLIGSVPMPVLAYLFLFDRHVAAYRRQIPPPTDLQALD